MPKKPQRLTVRGLITLGQTAQDTDKERDQKAVATLLLVLILVLRIVAFFLKDVSLFQKWVETSGISIELLGLFVLWKTRSVEKMFHWYVPIYLANLSYFVLANGTSSGDFVGFIAIPCVAVLVLGTDRSMLWLCICFFLMAAIPILDAVLPDIPLTAFEHPNNPNGSLFQAPGAAFIAPMEGISLAGIVFVIYFIFRAFYTQLNRAKLAVEIEKEKGDRLMDSIFPTAIANLLKNDTTAQISEHHASVSIVFADVVNFTDLAAEVEPDQVVETLNQIFSQIDGLASQFGVEKIKTIGDAYMGVSGLNPDEQDHLERIAAFSLAIRDNVGHLTRPDGTPIALRIGFHSGPVVAGVIGKSKPFYDIWGHTVNVAARLESFGVPGEIQLLATIADRLKRNFNFSNPNQIHLKGIGDVETVFLR